MKTIFVKPLTMQKKWYMIDAEGKELGKVAVAAARILRGKNKVEYVPHQDMGDFVIIINAEKAVLSGRKSEHKMYYRHSGYPGGFRQTNYADMVKQNPVYPLEHAVRGMLPRGPLGRKLFTNMRVYAGDSHPHMAQQPITVEI
jgi:large subunit ribosomal protein L13